MTTTPPKRMTLWPVPGGVGSYVESTRTILSLVGKGRERREAELSVVRAFPQLQSKTTARGYVSVLITLGLLRAEGGLVLPTSSGTRFHGSRDLAIIRTALFLRVFGVEEILSVLASKSLSFRELVAGLEDVGLGWTHEMSLRYRVWWLLASNAVVARRVDRSDLYSITPPGRRLL